MLPTIFGTRPRHMMGIPFWQGRGAERRHGGEIGCYYYYCYCYLTFRLFPLNKAPVRVSPFLQKTGGARLGRHCLFGLLHPSGGGQESPSKRIWVVQKDASIAKTPSDISSHLPETRYFSFLMLVPSSLPSTPHNVRYSSARAVEKKKTHLV